MNPADPHPEDPAKPSPRTGHQPVPPVQQPAPAPVTDQYGRPVDPVDPLDDERYERAVKDEILEKEVADERYERAVKDEKLEGRSKILVILTALALLVGIAGLYFGTTANNKAEDANDLATRNSANAVAIRAEVAKQLLARDAALNAAQRAAKARANKANQSASKANQSAASAKGKANANAIRIGNLRRENQNLKSAVSSLRTASRATNQRIDSIQQKLLNSRK